MHPGEEPAPFCILDHRVDHLGPIRILPPAPTEKHSAIGKEHSICEGEPRRAAEFAADRDRADGGSDVVTSVRPPSGEWLFGSI